MKRTISSVIAAAAAFGLLSTANAGGRFSSTVDVNTLPLDDTSVTVGKSTLKRSWRGIDVSIQTSHLDPNYTYTVWAVIFNYPEYCVGGCNGGDVFGFEDGADARVQASLLWLTGRVADGAAANFVASMRTAPAGLAGRDVISGGGLLNPKGAEVHFVIRCHGESLLPDIAAAGEQITTFDGACTDDQETNPCIDIQAAIHLPPGHHH